MANTQAAPQTAAGSVCVCPPHTPPYVQYTPARMTGNESMTFMPGNRSLAPPHGWKAYSRCDGSHYYYNETDGATTSCDMSVPALAGRTIAVLNSEGGAIRHRHCQHADIHIDLVLGVVSSGYQWDIRHIDHDRRIAQIERVIDSGDPFETLRPTPTASGSTLFLSATSSIACNFVPMTELEKELLYWNYIRLHPNHVDLRNSRQDMHDLLSWCRDERALSPDADVPFSQDESETFLKYLDGYDGGHMKNQVRQNCLLAALMERVVNYRHHRKEYLKQSIMPSQPEDSKLETMGKLADSWFINLLYFLVVIVFLLGQPHTYRRRLRRIEHFEASHAIDTLHWQAFIGAFVTEWEHANILATVMISATVGFLAVPGLDDLSRILGIISVLDAICSGLIGMVYVWHHGPRIKTTAKLGRVYIKHGSYFFGIHSPLIFACTLAIPVVLLWWSFLSFIGAVLVYAYRGQQPDAMGQMVSFSVTTKLASLVAFIFGVGGGAAGYVVMWQVWKPISEPWARMRSQADVGD